VSCGKGQATPFLAKGSAAGPKARLPSWNRKVTQEAKSNPGLSIARMVELGRVSRSSFYLFDGQAGAVRNQAMDLRDALQRIALEMPSYGRPRITAELRRRGWRVNPKR
jgi:hypothetical protein